jgi:hypothetical protein
MDPALLVCEGSPSNPKMNLQLLEMSNKRATGNIVIHKSLIISVLRMEISALSRLKYGFDPRTRCHTNSRVLSGVDYPRRSTGSWTTFVEYKLWPSPSKKRTCMLFSPTEAMAKPSRPC